MAQAVRELSEVGAWRVGEHRGGRRQRYALDDRGRRLILERYDGRTDTIDRLSRALTVPRWRVKRWAAELGLTYGHQPKMPPWTPQDVLYLEQHHQQVGIKQMAKHLGRTETAVRLKMKRLRLAKCSDDDGYTLRGLCELLGVDHHKLHRWIEAGTLHGTRRQTERTGVQGGDVWLFTPRAIRDFVTRHPSELDPRRVDFVWLVGILTNRE